MKLDKFTLAYIECALWASCDADGEPLDATLEDIAPETLQSMAEDCKDFQYIFGDLFLECMTLEQAGHDFWLTRNGHGAGFWDRELGDIGTQLTAMSKAYGSCDLYTGDDGKVYLS